MWTIWLVRKTKILGPPKAVEPRISTGPEQVEAECKE